jgi:hypothetical protein
MFVDQSMDTAHQTDRRHSADSVSLVSEPPVSPVKPCGKPFKTHNTLTPKDAGVARDLPPIRTCSSVISEQTPAVAKLQLSYRRALGRHCTKNRSEIHY